MKIYRNPDKTGLDFLLPTLFFVCMFSLPFLLSITCISFNDFFGFAVTCLIIVYALYFLLVKFEKIKKIQYANLLLSVIGLPTLVCLGLFTNFIFAKTVFYKKVTLKNAYVIRNNGCYFVDVDAPDVCSRFYKLGHSNLEFYYETVEIEIGKGYLGYFVLKKNKLE